MAVVRGCGTRVAGGTYIEVKLGGAEGRPIEHFLFDEPWVIPQSERTKRGIKPRGVTLYTDDSGINHVVDWIGSGYYPNVLDWVEEARRFGVSRRCEGVAYAKLGLHSRLIVLHSRAYVASAEALHRRVLEADETHVECAKRLPEHEPLAYRGACAGLWWHDLHEGATPHGGDGDVRTGAPLIRWNQERPLDLQNPRFVQRQMPSFRYAAWRRPDDFTPLYEVAAFAAFPISRLVVVKDPKQDKHVKALERASVASLPVEEVDE